MLKWIRSLLGSTRTPEVEDWFHVRWDEVSVHLEVSPPGRDPWSASFEWSTVVRVCFQAEDLGASDGIYVFTSTRPESYAIPMEASGGSELWTEILSRKLFDAELAVKAMSSPEGSYCWPAADE
jgi:hypothetical protein